MIHLTHLPMNSSSSFRSFVPRVLQLAALLAFAAGSGYAQTNFFDDFESGTLAKWGVASGTTAMYITSTNNKVPTGGTYSVKGTNASDKMFANFSTPITAGSFKLTYWLYDSAATRAYVDVRQYTGGAYNSGTLGQLLAIGKYNSLSPGPYFAGEVWDGTKYQARVANGTSFGWFNLNNPGVPNRSTGWHRFDIERGTNTDGTINLDFYIDSILGRRLTNTYTAWSTQVWNCVLAGFGTASASNGDEFYDGVQIVQGEPWFAQQPVSATNTVGNNFTLTAVVDGLPGTAYQWRKDGIAIAGATTTTLTLINAQTTNSGTYVLFASNQVGTATSTAAYVQVNPLNLITVPPTNQIVNVGDPASFYAEATGSGTIYYQWNKDGIPIPGPTGTGASSTYSIASTTTNDQASYTVTVTNSAGDPPTTSSAAFLTVNTPPTIPAIADQTATVSNYFVFTPAITDDLDVQTQPFQDFETNSVGSQAMFQNASFSGTTGTNIDASGRSYVTNVVPAGHKSAQALHVSWNWTNNNLAQIWLRLTTANGGTMAGPNPTISFSTPLRFDIYADKNLLVAGGDRERRPTVARAGSAARVRRSSCTAPVDPTTS